MASRTLCLTPGDPTGIGPEVTVKFLTCHLRKYPNYHFHVIGALGALEKAVKILGCTLPVDQVTYTDVSGQTPGEIAYHALEKAVALIAAGDADAMVTGPISKSNLKEAGILASGHTEILELLARKHYPTLKPKAEMLFVYRNFRLMLLTRHIPLSQVSKALTQLACQQSLSVLINFLREYLGIVKPRIAVLGVNPHAGEVGGKEEADVLLPVIQAIHAEGPFAADGFFRGFDAENPGYDAVVAAYHDQGLIPFKLIAGHRAVNVTIGLPFLRTSVGHGTAFDIAGQGIADETGLISAIEIAVALISPYLVEIRAPE